MDGVGRFARFEMCALSQLANQLVEAFLGFAKIFSRFLHLRVAVGQRRFLAREHEQPSPAKVTIQSCGMYSVSSRPEASLRSTAALIRSSAPLYHSCLTVVAPPDS